LKTNFLIHLRSVNGIELSDDDKVDIERMQEKLKERDDLHAVMTSNNTLEHRRYKFDKVVDELLLDFVHTKLDLYKKLSDPKVNPMLKSKWFEGFMRNRSDQSSQTLA
jgi:type I restriction enzyme, R subunit